MKNGLKGVTDATVFCKSMQKGGAKPMIRSMKSYEVGGATEQCGPGDGRKGCRKKTKSRSKGMSEETRGGVLGTLGAMAAGALGFGAYKKMKSKE
jgi:hypothetical protein